MRQLLLIILLLFTYGCATRPIDKTQELMISTKVETNNIGDEVIVGCIISKEFDYGMLSIIAVINETGTDTNITFILEADGEFVINPSRYSGLDYNEPLAELRLHELITAEECRLIVDMIYTVETSRLTFWDAN
jgi:hypothetical protein